ncbi:MAG: hypothetical protein PF630_05305 [Gammaproteobacteria bacterium]|nr:hypothetical protein [Gammaproteobacteria bacterium]
MNHNSGISPPDAAGRLRFWLQPLHDYVSMLESISQHFSWIRLTLLLLALVAGWWLYVPVHELLHAFGCIWSGGEVSQLDLRAEYGAAWLQQYLPWISVGSDYAGQLSGFDTGGSDLVYLATVLMPYLLTVFPGLWLWTLALHGNWQLPWAWLLTGFSFSMVAAPFISLFGDMYESTSIIVTRLLVLADSNTDVARWRSDDVLLLIQQLWPQWRWTDAIVISCAWLLAVLLAWLLYWSGRQLARYLLAWRRTDD